MKFPEASAIGTPERTFVHGTKRELARTAKRAIGARQLISVGCLGSVRSVPVTYVSSAVNVLNKVQGLIKKNGRTRPWNMDKGIKSKKCNMH